MIINPIFHNFNLILLDYSGIRNKGFMRFSWGKLNIASDI
jgi:hypothetical protein